MNRARLSLATALAVVLPLAGAWLPGGNAGAQTFPVVGGTQEVQIGFSVVTLPEITGGTWSAQPELRWGLFIADGLEIQVTADARAYPLGTTAPKSYGGGVNVLWFPVLGDRDRNFYLLAGGGGAYSDPSSPAIDASFDPAGRIGLGVKVPLDAMGLGFLMGRHLGAEYRGDFVFLNEDADDYPYEEDFATSLEYVSGFTIGVSFIL